MIRWGKPNYEPDIPVEEFTAYVVGRTIVGVRDETIPDAGWTDHGRIVLVLSDGSEIACGGWGHDAWGPDLMFTRPEGGPNARQRAWFDQFEAERLEALAPADGDGPTVASVKAILRGEGV